MAILKIARMGHPVLSRPAEPVADPTAPEIRELVTDMIETMEDAEGLGLAAPQVHVPKRVVIFLAPRDDDHDTDRRDEQQLARLDPDVEEQQRQRYGLRRQADLGQCAREAEAVQQPEGERDDPRPALRQSRSPLPCVRDLAGDEDDAQRDDRLDGCLRYVHEAQRRGTQRQAVCHGERRNRPHETPSAVDQNQQSEHEQQVVDSEQDVLDPQTRVGPCHLYRRG